VSPRDESEHVRGEAADEMLTTDAGANIRPCRCSGCSATHHQTGAVALARWYLDFVRKPRQEVCGTCANLRTSKETRGRQLKPMPRQWRSAVGKMVAGLEVRGVSIGEGLLCECYDPGCPCRGTCTRRAVYLWGGVDEGDWQHLCRVCGWRLVERGTPPSSMAPGVQPPEVESKAGGGR